ncbi:MAG: endopeptidase La [Clostridia bacterium]|nr:endopeptidase La [Clostridia bacterium]
MEDILLNEIMPVVALRGLVVFPGDTLHFEVGRKKSIRALDKAMRGKRLVFLVAQKEVGIEEPSLEDLYKVGVVASIKQTVKMPNSDHVRVTVEGLYRGEIDELVSERMFLSATIKKRKEPKIREEEKDYLQALVRKVKDEFEVYANIAPRIAPDLMLKVIDEKDPSRLADYIAGNIMLEYEQRYYILSCLNVVERLIKVCVMLERESQLLALEEKIQNKVSEQINQNQKEFYLREQLKAISQELNDDVGSEDELREYRDKILSLKLDKKFEDKLLRECTRLERMSLSSPEANVSRTYLDTVLNLPWNVYTEDRLDLSYARKVLDDEHYGMEKVKKRIIEALAVRKLNPDITGQIICLVGPPGVGKTSIASSIAKAMGRKYVRISLGGVRDEAEIRGHRKTYIGAMPGRIISAINMAKSSNPLMLLDEIDKVGTDHKGDPASALLEALDSEQNNAFCDHYVEIPFDLSKVLFITTANDVSTIPAPLLDRMEVIELSSYTAEEKFNIAKKHLAPKQRKKHGLNGNMLRISDTALKEIISSYTKEAGVRKLERQISSLCRKAAMYFDENQKCLFVKGKNLEEILGPKKYKQNNNNLKDEIGVVNGLAWTAVGGEMLQVEVAIMDGTGKLELTGSLGDVMKESAKAALSYIRSHADEYNIEKEFYKTKDIHIHVPEGAVPKDGPSAGVTMATALVSALTKRKVDRFVAMTGEISLTGKVMTIGGLREKSMAAYINSIKRVLIPEGNVADLDEVADCVKENVEFIAVDSLGEVFKYALIKQEDESIIKNEMVELTGKKVEKNISSAMTQ